MIPICFLCVWNVPLSRNMSSLSSISWMNLGIFLVVVVVANQLLRLPPPKVMPPEYDVGETDPLYITKHRRKKPLFAKVSRTWVRRISPTEVSFQKSSSG
jgi:hypothetical protein